MLIGDLIQEVCKDFDISYEDLMGPRKYRHFLPARFALYMVLHKRKVSIKRIGTICNGRDHKTISHGISRADYMMGVDPIYREKIERLAGLRVDLTNARLRMEDMAA